MQFTLFLKAGRSSPDSLGMCLPGQSAHLLAKIKSLAFQPRMMHLDNPPPEFSSVGFQRLPAVLHSDGNGVDEDVVKDLAAKYPEGLLNPDPKDAAKAENVTKYIYPKFCEYMHGGDISELEAALQGLEQYLREGEHNFLFGDEMSLLDCIVLPQLHVIRVVLERVKDVPIPGEIGSRLWMYMFHGYQRKQFIKTCPTDMEICLDWAAQVGVPESDIKMPEWLPKDHHGSYYSFGVPNICVCPQPAIEADESSD